MYIFEIIKLIERLLYSDYIILNTLKHYRLLRLSGIMDR